MIFDFQYYKALSLSEEELQKRKNQCSRHRHKYERPNTPEGIIFYFSITFYVIYNKYNLFKGFWDPEFPETDSS